MKTFIKGVIEYRPATYQGECEFSFHICALESLGYIKVMDHVIEIDIPSNFDPRGIQVEMLKTEKIKLMADFQKRCTEIERKISELTAITCEMAA